jgi:acyl-CoA thioesterase I
VRRFGAALGAALLMAACAGQSPASTRTPEPPPLTDAHVYVAIGASETVGIGAAAPERDGWTARFYRAAVPSSGVFYDLGEVGATTALAETDQVPVALSLHPDLVTVWLNTNDITHSVPVAVYEAQLDDVLSRLHRAGAARVLVANTPVLSGLPAYRGCLPDAPASLKTRCLFTAGPVPAPDQLDRLVDAYNGAVARVAARESATLVDVHCQGDMASLHPNWLSDDGFHPNGDGYAEIAGAFEAALKGGGCYRPA